MALGLRLWPGKAAAAAKARSRAVGPAHARVCMCRSARHDVCRACAAASTVYACACVVPSRVVPVSVPRHGGYGHHCISPQQRVQRDVHLLRQAYTWNDMRNELIGGMRACSPHPRCRPRAPCFHSWPCGAARCQGPLSKARDHAQAIQAPCPPAIPETQLNELAFPSAHYQPI